MTELQLEIQKIILKRIDLSEYNLYHDFISSWGNSIVADRRYELALNKPVTMQRVLIALWHRYFYYDKMIFCREYDDDWEYSNNICLRKLLNEDWSDATLRDQSEETQNKVAELLWVTF